MAGPYTWDAKALSYRGARGRFVGAREVREGLDDALDAASARMKALTVSLRERRISVAEWQTAMGREVKNVHLYSAAAAKGGWSQMTPADYGRAGQRIRTQYDYLNARAAKIASGEQKLDGSLDRIAAMYGQAGRGTYHAVEQREQALRGADQERNIRGARDSCDGCVSASARGWVALGTLVPVGSRDCKTACRCRIEYRASDAARLAENSDSPPDQGPNRGTGAEPSGPRAPLPRRNRLLVRRVESAERSLRTKTDFEEMRAFALDGTELARHTSRRKDTVLISEMIGERYRGAVVTHNHPNRGVGLSHYDVRAAVDYGWDEIRAVDAKTGTYTYALRRPVEGWGSRAAFDDAWRTTLPQVERDFREQVVAGRLTEEEAAFHLQHETLKRVAASLNWFYRRTP